MNNTNERAAELHKKYHGKIEVRPKMDITTKEDLALVYTPGVGHVSSLIAADPKLAREYTLKHNTVAVISDGSAVLGLGNIGAEGAIPVMEGKALLFKALADIDAFPICIRTQDTDELVQTILNIAPVFGGINLEDISAPRCFEVERRVQEALDIPVVHDDQHGTAVVALAGIMNALTLRGGSLETARVVINGAGAAGTAIAELLHAAGVRHLVLLDSKGIIGPARTDLNDEKKKLLEYTNTDGLGGNLQDALRDADIFIGVSTANIMTRDDVQLMAKDPIVFAMANPIPEIMPDEAKAGGAFIVGTGRSDFPNQLNNALVFPGLFKGALIHGLTRINETHFLKAAKALASYIEPTREQILPDVLDKGVAGHIAAAMAPDA